MLMESQTIRERLSRKAQNIRETLGPKRAFVHQPYTQSSHFLSDSSLCASLKQREISPPATGPAVTDRIRVRWAARRKCRFGPVLRHGAEKSKTHAQKLVRHLEHEFVYLQGIARTCIARLVNQNPTDTASSCEPALKGVSYEETAQGSPPQMYAAQSRFEFSEPPHAGVLGEAGYLGLDKAETRHTPPLLVHRKPVQNKKDKAIKGTFHEEISCFGLSYLDRVPCRPGTVHEQRKSLFEDISMEVFGPTSIPDVGKLFQTNSNVQNTRTDKAFVDPKTCIPAQAEDSGSDKSFDDSSCATSRAFYTRPLGVSKENEQGAPESRACKGQRFKSTNPFRQSEISEHANHSSSSSQQTLISLGDPDRSAVQSGPLIDLTDAQSPALDCQLEPLLAAKAQDEGAGSQAVRGLPGSIYDSPLSFRRASVYFSGEVSGFVKRVSGMLVRQESA